MKKNYINKNKYKNIIEITIIVILLIVASTFSYADIYAKFKATSASISSIEVAKFGNLKLTEMSADSSEEITYIENEAPVKNLNVRSGEDIVKNITVEYTEGDVDVYIFFAVYTKSWTFVEEEKKFYMNNYIGDNYLMYWNINQNWDYLKQDTYSKDDEEIPCYVFYRELNKNEGLKDVLLDKINVNLISAADISYLNNKTELGFGAYVISKQDLSIPSLAWQSIKNKIE